MQTDELANRRWLAIPSSLRKNLEENVYCSSCGVTTIVNYYVDSEDYQIILKGHCKNCDQKVARVID
ncbi:hypothetical protein GH741_00195 [Aquibacillus halophilus]|uniref:Uncharacterized protein n=1 Tax=Aquibacillus halophilus TaxID=930132 RepID=A0A6A8DBE8_9BACI|nr:hypothetical protein [Aquibacillus halophilus]MRH41091.1 hypothetical protein [Aquibacillus halophilus]